MGMVMGVGVGMWVVFLGGGLGTEASVGMKVVLAAIFCILGWVLDSSNSEFRRTLSVFTPLLAAEVELSPTSTPAWS